MKLFYTLIFIFSVQQTVMAAEQQYEKHADITQLAKEFLSSSSQALGSEITVSINKINQRLNLKKCTSALTVAATSGAVKPGRNTLQINCHSSTPWHIFISGSVQVMKNVVVAKHFLQKGHILNSRDIKIKKIDLSKVHNQYFEQTSSLLNMTLTRNVSADTILSGNNLTAPVLIKRGDTVSIVSSQKGFKISMKGTAQANGRAGDTIKVKNSRTKKMITGTVINKNTVNVGI